MTLYALKSFKHKFGELVREFLVNSRKTLLVLCVTLMVVASVSSSAWAQTKTNLSLLQKGLRIRYAIFDVWRLPSDLGGGNYTHEGNITVTVLDVDTALGLTKIQYDTSLSFTFPRQTTSYDLSLLNTDNDFSKYAFVGVPVPPYTIHWSSRQVITLNGRTALKIEGERTDIMTVRAHGDFGYLSTWVSQSWDTDFPLNIPTWLFIDPGTKPGELVEMGPDSGASYSSSKMIGFSLPIRDVRSIVLPLGQRAALFAQTITKSNLIGMSWVNNQTYYYDQESGTLLSYQLLANGTIKSTQGPGGSEILSIQLAEVLPFPTTITATSIPAKLVANSFLNLTGSLTPAFGTTPLYVIEMSPNGTVVSDQNITTTREGAFNATLQLKAGNWSLLIRYPGSLFAQPSNYTTNVVVGQQSNQPSVAITYSTPSWIFIAGTLALLVVASTFAAVKRSQHIPRQLPFVNLKRIVSYIAIATGFLAFYFAWPSIANLATPADSWVRQNTAETNLLTQIFGLLIGVLVLILEYRRRNTRDSPNARVAGKRKIR